jgi:NAD(P)H-quinone oxidoreductase subunit 5
MWLRIQFPSLAMAILVLLVGALIARFSKRYLHGEKQLPMFYRQLTFTLLSVLCFVLTDNLVVMAVAWTSTSVAIQPLLRFHRDRPEAAVAAYKKFVMSRVADVLVLASVILFARAHGTLQISELVERIRANPPGLASYSSIAGLLLSLAVIVRTAQLPFHGWLIQVMEAPTPVSALLHAGVVNLGGFLLIRMGPAFVHLPLAQTALVLWGTFSALFAGLAMSTRVSVKVALAWSTSAQMGFMLLECGLGAHHLALVHLVAHSLYKAYAFLSCGRTVERSIVRSMTQTAPFMGFSQISGLFLSAVVAIGIALAGAYAGAPVDGAGVVLLAIAAIAVSPFFAHSARGGARSMMLGIAALVAFNVLDYQLAALLGARVRTQLHLLVLAAPVLGFVGFWALGVWLAYMPRHPIALRVHAAAFAGFYLDEVLTRFVFKVSSRNPSNVVVFSVPRLRNI